MSNEPEKSKLEVVVNGQTVTVDVNPNEELIAVAERALKESMNEGRPLKDWQLKDQSGAVVDSRAKVSALQKGFVLYLSLDAGVTG